MGIFSSILHKLGIGKDEAPVVAAAPAAAAPALPVAPVAQDTASGEADQNGG